MWRWWHTRPCSSSQRWAAPRLCSVGSTEKWSRRTGREGPGPDRRAPHLPVRRWTSNRKIWNLKSWGNNSHINNDKRFINWRDHKGHSTPWSHPLKDVLWKALMYADRLCTTQETADPQCISSEQKSRWATHWRNTCCYLLRELGSAFKQQQALRLVMPVWCVSPLFSAVGDTPRKRLNKKYNFNRSGGCVCVNFGELLPGSTIDDPAASSHSRSTADHISGHDYSVLRFSKISTGHTVTV